MDLLIARRLANSLMEQFGLKELGWRFAFDESKSHFGCCNYREKVIFLSRIFCLTIVDTKVKDTILHEISHVLTPGHGHDIIWRAKAISIGCNGERCGNITKEAASEFLLDKFKKAINNYQTTCPVCGRVGYSKHIIDTSCGLCSPGKYNPIFKLKLKKL